jgi:hypothetical protein
VSKWAKMFEQKIRDLTMATLNKSALVSIASDYESIISQAKAFGKISAAEYRLLINQIESIKEGKK